MVSPRTIRIRLVCLLKATPLFAEDLHRHFNLSSTAALQENLLKWNRKIAEVNPKFYKVVAMTNEILKGPDRSNRHVVQRAVFTIVNAERKSFLNLMNIIIILGLGNLVICIMFLVAHEFHCWAACRSN